MRRPEVEVEFVYFIEAAGLDAVKIGYSKRPWARLDNLKVGSPVDLKMLWLFLGTRSVEKFLHYQFQNHKLERPGGEWFRLSNVRAGFSYYGIDPSTLTPPIKYKYDVSGELPAGLVPKGARLRGLTTVAIEQKKRFTPHRNRGQTRPIAVGEAFGWQVVVEQIEEDTIKCRCRCGSILFRTPEQLLSGNRRSCYECSKAERAERRKVVR